MTGWNFADVWDAVAHRLPDAPALLGPSGARPWADFERRAAGVARTLLDSEGSVAQYLYNRPEYLEAVYGAFKVGRPPVNTNYRYVEEELLYLWDNADAGAVVFQGCFTERVDALRGRLPKVRQWIRVDDGSGPCPDWALDYEAAAAAEPASGPRSGDDLYLLYTGGTTGMPKGVMWRQDDLFAMLNASSLGARYPDGGDASSVATTLPGPGFVGLPAAPLMHGTGALIAFSTLSTGGAVVTLPGRTFEPTELLDAVQEHRVNVIAWVGDAFAKPVLRALDAGPGRWDVSSLFAIVSSGVMWAEETKQGLLRHHPGMLLIDAFSSSEALGMGMSISSAGGTTTTARFALGENAKVLTDDGREVAPGSGEVGRVAVRGRTPVGYYKDEEKSARTFLVIDGHRWSVPGDYATVEADGTLRLLGRGSVTVNTGGEKVHAEEVEEAVKTHPAVADAVVVGVADEKWGQAVVAVVEPLPGHAVDEAGVVAHVKERLAAFKAPKRVVVVDSIGRAANGKVDYALVRAAAESA
jgi:acyl-CoA synthetase (AMP-forming)/AMP-acid ligase II